MLSRRAGIAAPAVRAVRGLWPDRNPLLVAQTGGHIGYRVAVRTAHAEQSRRQVPAVLRATARQEVGARVPASWRAPDGVRRTGTISVPRGAQFEGPPRGQAVLGAVIAVTGLGWVLCCAGLCSRGLLGRRRLAAWDSDSQITEPQWTGRR